MNRITLSYINAATLLSAIAFSAEGAAAGAATATKEKQKPRVAPEILGIDTDVPMPEGARTARGTKSPYEFDKLEVGHSIPIKNKTAKQISSIVSNQNRKDSNQQQKKNADGSLAFKNEKQDMKDANGNVVGSSMVQVPDMEPIKEFRVLDVDPKKDPKNAKCRIFRIK